MTDTPKPIQTLTQTVTITNKRGLHARASARFVACTEQFIQATITVTKDGYTVTGNSIMGLMMLGASCGTQITITVSSADISCATQALENLMDLLNNKFGEAE